MASLDGILFLTTAVAAGSFAAAAKRLSVTPSAVSRRIANLERELGVSLLSRTTRSLRLTDDGEVFHTRCVRILQELNEARDAVARSTKRPSGLLRVDAPSAISRTVLAENMPRFLDRYPEVRIHLSVSDHHVDPVAEGIDVLIRIGDLGDSSLISRRLGESQVLLCAAPTYLAKHGTPNHPRDTAHHRCLGYLRDGRPWPLTFTVDNSRQTVEIDGPFHANDSAVLARLARAGSGIVGLFDFMVEDMIARGELVTVLDAYASPPWPIHALYPKSRHLLPKVTVFLDFLREVFGSTPRTSKGAASSSTNETNVHRRRTRRARTRAP